MGIRLVAIRLAEAQRRTLCNGESRVVDVMLGGIEGRMNGFEGNHLLGVCACVRARTAATKFEYVFG